jgi:hypothetical protein
MAARGVLLTYKAELSCRRKFAHAYANQLRPKRHLLPALLYRQKMSQRFQAWRETTRTPIAA